jgi:hypothetical protein
MTPFSIDDQDLFSGSLDLSSGDLDLASHVHLDLLTPVLLNQRPWLYFGCLIFQLDQLSCGPLLDQGLRSPLGLQTFEISNIKLLFPSKYADSCCMSS